jgi:NAD-dependent deacetylase sirtuin 2
MSENDDKSLIDRLENAFKRLTTESSENSSKSLDLKSFAEHMKKSKNIIFMCGAGISTSANIPDFRSPVTGLYNNLEKYNLPNPMLIFDIGFFKKNPNSFFTLAKELLPSNYRPTISHYFQRLLIEKNMVLKIYSQNIDALENVAQIPEDKIIYAHDTDRLRMVIA